MNGSKQNQRELQAKSAHHYELHDKRNSFSLVDALMGASDLLTTTSKEKKTMCKAPLNMTNAFHILKSLAILTFFLLVHRLLLSLSFGKKDSCCFTCPFHLVLFKPSLRHHHTLDSAICPPINEKRRRTCHTHWEF